MRGGAHRLSSYSSVLSSSSECGLPGHPMDDRLVPSLPLSYFSFLHSTFMAHLLVSFLSSTRPDCGVGFSCLLISQGLTQCLAHKQDWTLVE